jgi:hypothetical protein
MGKTTFKVECLNPKCGGKKGPWSGKRTGVSGLPWSPKTHPRIRKDADQENSAAMTAGEHATFDPCPKCGGIDLRATPVG